MDRNEFWRLIAAAKAESNGGCIRQVAMLEKTLAALPEQEIIAFNRIFDEHMAVSYNWDLWAAAYSINGGCSDDCFDYFRGWLMAQGPTIFYNALEDPETLIVADIDLDQPDIECQHLLGVARRAYKTRTGAEFPRQRQTWMAAGPSGETWQEKDLATRYPRLWAKFVV